MSTSNKAVIIGVGNVGATLAYTLALKHIVSEIVLVDLNEKRVEGEVLDLSHAQMYLGNIKVTAGDSSSVEDAKYVVITAGAKQNEGETRLDLIDKNIKITKSILDGIKPFLNDQFLILVSNPVDIITYFTLAYLNYDKKRVFGTGTSLDTARLRYLLGTKLNLSPSHIHSYIIGEHGDSSVPVFETATVLGKELNDFGLGKSDLDNIYNETRDAAYRVIDAKGATFYAIALVTSEIIKSIQYDQGRIFPVSTYIDNMYGIKDVCLSLPCVMTSSGVDRVLELDLSNDEKSKLEKSASILKEHIENIKI